MKHEKATDWPFEQLWNFAVGNSIIDKKTGIVLKCQMDDGDHLDKIIKFDLEEFRKRYNYTLDRMPTSVDILDFGYWYKLGERIEYEDPAHDWRTEFRNHS